VTISYVVFAAVLIVILLTFAAYSGWKQWQVLREANADSTLSPEDLKYFRRQAGRRLICACLMIALAGVLIGSFFFEERARDVANRVQEARDRGEEASPEDRRFGDFYATVWIGALLALLGLILMAGMDYVAIRRYGRRHYQIIQAERRAMIQEELKRYRREQSERN
jgi:ABC-type Fe3+ transport system permease subunit